MNSVKKAVIPAAGYGTRMLPASKAIPKELFPVAGKPVIQHIVEEAVDAGIEEILIIISEGKEVIKSHFSTNSDLEDRLILRNKEEELKEIQKLSNLARIEYQYQPEQKGLGDAILLSKSWVGNDPFMIMLGDTIINPISETQKLISSFLAFQSDIVQVREVAPDQVSKYGIMDGSFDKDKSLYKVNKWIEKPSQELAPSNLAIAGRYIFTPNILKYLECTDLGIHKEIQLTDAMQAMLRDNICFAQVLKGRRFDIGNWEEFIKANIELSDCENL